MSANLHNSKSSPAYTGREARSPLRIVGNEERLCRNELCGRLFAVTRKRKLFCSKPCTGKFYGAQRRGSNPNRHIMVRLPNGSRQYLHRLVMIAVLGRALSSDEIVHHKDENKHNNAPSNLEVLSGPDAHAHLHMHARLEVMRRRVKR